jgi:hypothetical protein
MKKHIPLTAISLALLVGVGTVQTAYAGENDALGISTAKVTLVEAVTAAEDHVGGTASHAEFKPSGDRAVFEVEVVADGQATDVKVDASNGEILSSRADRPDHEEDAEREDHEDHEDHEDDSETERED